jgi:hypothetical protein
MLKNGRQKYGKIVNFLIENYTTFLLDRACINSEHHALFLRESAVG